MKKLLLCGGVFGLLSMFSVNASTSSNQTLDALMQQWISIESQKGQLQRSWSTQEQHLRQKLALLKTEKKALQAILSKTSDKKTELDSQRLELIGQQNNLEQEQVIIKAKIAELSDYFFTLLPKLPPPLQSTLQKKLQILKRDSASVSEKLERLLSSLKLINEFDERIAVNKTSVRIADSSDDEQDLLVTQVYLGLSQAWYVSENGQNYGYGRSEHTEWTWWHKKKASLALGQELAPESLLELVEIIQNPTKARFLSLPIQVQTDKDMSK